MITSTIALWIYFGMMPVIAIAIMVLYQLGVFKIVNPKEDALEFLVGIGFWPLLTGTAVAVLVAAGIYQVLWFIAKGISNTIMKLFPGPWQKDSNEGEAD